MTLVSKYDKMIYGIISGIFLPLLTGLLIYLFTSRHLSIHSYLVRIVESDIITHAITLCVFPNVFIFLLFNRFDMLNSARGVLATTIIWALIVFGVKFLA
jgi:hypothetical protein